jgi:hypothetical protein
LGRSVAELKSTVGGAEYEDWQRFFSVEPFGAYRDNLHAGIIASAIINSSMNRRRGVAAVTPADFVLRTRASERAQETASTLAVLRAVSKRKVTA